MTSPMKGMLNENEVWARSCRRTGQHRWAISAEDYAKREISEVRYCSRPGCQAKKTWFASPEPEPVPSAILPVREILRLRSHHWGEPKGEWSYEDA